MARKSGGGAGGEVVVPKTAAPMILNADSLAKLSPTDRDAAERLLRDVGDLSSRIARMGRVILEMSDEGRELFIGAFPAAMQPFWERVLRVGRGLLHPALAAEENLAARMLGKLPLEQQEKLIADRIPVVIEREEDFDELRMEVGVMSSAQRQQVFASAAGATRVRSIQEQRAWLADRQRKAADRAAAASFTRWERNGKWTIEDGRAMIDPVLFERGLSKADVALLLKDFAR